MLDVADQDIVLQSGDYFKKYKKLATAPLPYDNFVRKVFPQTYKMTKGEYPKVIKIPKSIPEMLEGDLSPAREIVIEKPIIRKITYMEDSQEKTADVPIWFNNSLKGVYLRFGYLNGDSRYPSMQKMDDKDIHMVLAGATGQGKSVCLNNIIFNLCEEYAPWEVKLTLCDAKITEFKKYAVDTPMPHISAVAATSDADYLISVLNSVLKEMMQMNNVLVEAHVGNIEDFRKATGLTVPHNIIIMDEFQTMLKYAGKKIDTVLKILDGIARLGRNTGYHLLLASQELGKDIPADTLANIKIRGALGCTAPISEMILGNDEAKLYYGRKGNIIINTNPADSKKEENRLYKIPFLEDSRKLEVGQYIVKLGDAIGFKYSMTFYDAQAVVREKDYSTFLNSFNLEKNTIMLGEPSFVITDPEKVLKIHYTGNDIENLMVISTTNKVLQRFFIMLKKNIERISTPENNIVLCVDASFELDCDAKSLCGDIDYFKDKTYNNNQFFNIVHRTIAKRKIMLAIDDLVLRSTETTEESDELFYSVISKGSEFDTTLYRARFYHGMCLLMGSVEHSKAFGYTSMTESEAYAEAPNDLLGILKTFKFYGASEHTITKEEMPPTYAWILGIQRVIGLGRDSKSAYITELKQMMQDSSEVNVRFFIFNTTMEELYELRSGIRWYLFEDLPQNEQSRIKCEDYYPGSRSQGLGILYDTQAEGDDRCFKFKKMYFNDELVDNS